MGRAAQLSHGTKLYSQIEEVNPPLWFWLASLLSRVSDALGVSGEAALKGFIVAAISLSSVMVAGLCREGTPRERACIYLGLLFAQFVLSLRDFGQREHYALIVTLPYLALLARRGSGLPIHPAFALLVGLFAASGFMLKPYFALVPLILEAWLILSIRGRWRPWRPEIFALVGAAGAYLTALLAFAPDYWGVMAPAIRLAYDGYRASPRSLIEQGSVMLAAEAFVAAILLGGLRSPLASASLAAAAAFLACFFIQAKGWSYHSLPYLGLVAFAALVELTKLRWSGASIRRKAGGALLALVLVLMADTAAFGGGYWNAYRASTEAAWSGLRPGQVVMTFSWHASSTWPMVQERGLVWPSRHYTFWMLPKIAAARAAGIHDANLETLGRRVRSETFDDLRCHPPARILVDDPHRSTLYKGGDFDFIAFFSEDPNLGAFLNQYRVTGSAGPFTVYAPRAPILPEPPPRGCRVIY